MPAGLVAPIVQRGLEHPERAAFSDRLALAAELLELLEHAIGARGLDRPGGNRVPYVLRAPT